MTTPKEAALVLAPLFERMGWRWAHATTESGVPSVTDIEKCIRSLAADCRRGVRDTLENGGEFEGYSVATGRLCVRAEKWSDTAPFEYELSLELGDL